MRFEVNSAFLWQSHSPIRIVPHDFASIRVWCERTITVSILFTVTYYTKLN